MAGSVREDGLVASARGPRADRPKRRTFTLAYKLAIVEEYDQLADERDRGALHGLPASPLIASATQTSPAQRHYAWVIFDHLRHTAGTNGCRGSTAGLGPCCFACPVARQRPSAARPAGTRVCGLARSRVRGR